MPPALLLALGVGGGLCCGLELCAVAGADDDGVLLAGGLLVPDEPPQAVTSATSAAGMIIRRRFVIKNLLRWAGRSACGCPRTLQTSGSPAVGKSARLTQMVSVGVAGHRHALTRSPPPISNVRRMPRPTRWSMGTSQCHHGT